MSQLPPIRTRHNLQAALAGESMAHIKYRYFARLCRAQGDETTAQLFEATADQEIQHAWGHLELLMAAETLSPARCLQLAIEGETYEYTEMYPKFRAEAASDGDAAAEAELDAQIRESREHAEGFAAQLTAAQIAKAQKRFEALARVEERHANHYRARLAGRAA
jgi:rubrerythrin